MPMMRVQLASAVLAGVMVATVVGCGAGTGDGGSASGGAGGKGSGPSGMGGSGGATISGVSSVTEEASVKCSRYEPTDRSDGQAMTRSQVWPRAITLGPAMIFQRNGGTAAWLSSVREGCPDRTTTA